MTGHTKGMEGMEGNKQEPIIRLEGLGKQFSTANGTVTALEDINLEIKSGEIFGIIGDVYKRQATARAAATPWAVAAPWATAAPRATAAPWAVAAPVRFAAPYRAASWKYLDFAK